MLCYRRTNECPDARKGVGAAIAYHTSTTYTSPVGPDLGVGSNVKRALYFQCDRKQSGNDFGDTSERLSPSDVVWSLICQCLLMDCTTVPSIDRRIVELDSQSRKSLRKSLSETMGGSRTEPLSLLFDIFLLALESIKSPLLIAIDNIHLLGDFPAASLVDALRVFIEQRLPAAHRHLPTLITGCIYGELEERLSGIPVIADDTERKGVHND